MPGDPYVLPDGRRVVSEVWFDADGARVPDVVGARSGELLVVDADGVESRVYVTF